MGKCRRKKRSCNSLLIASLIYITRLYSRPSHKQLPIPGRGREAASSDGIIAGSDRRLAKSDIGGVANLGRVP